MKNLKNKKPIKVEIYSKPDCHLCDVAKSVILKVKEDCVFELQVHDIETNPEWFEAFKEQIPVVFIDSRKAFKYRVDENSFRKRIAGCLK